jgi:hypothetical protein
MKKCTVFSYLGLALQGGQGASSMTTRDVVQAHSETTATTLYSMPLLFVSSINDNDIGASHRFFFFVSLTVKTQ